MKNRIDQAIMLIDAITETPDQRAERLEEARIENLEYEAECKESRTGYEDGMFNAGLKESDFL